MSVVVKKDLAKLRALQAALGKAKSARVRVGCLGNEAERTDEDWNKEGINNPTLGMWHEFGTKQSVTVGRDKWGHPMRRVSGPLPPRSFLRMPLMTRLPGQIDKIGRKVWQEFILKHSIEKALDNLGALGVGIVRSAFATGGFGQWAPVSTRYAKWKETRMRLKHPGGKNFIGPIQQATLILSAQLRNSINHAVVMGRGKSG